MKTLAAKVALVTGASKGVSATIAMTFTSVLWSATKGAIDTLMQRLARELGPRHIRVNALAPGIILTEGLLAAKKMNPEMKARLIAAIPLGHFGLPEDVAQAALFARPGQVGLYQRRTGVDCWRHIISPFRRYKKGTRRRPFLLFCGLWLTRHGDVILHRLHDAEHGCLHG